MDQNLLKKLEQVEAAAAADVMTAMGLNHQVLSPAFRPLGKTRMSGIALCARGDTRPDKEALPTFQLDKSVVPGAIIMIEVGPDARGAVIGENMTLSMIQRGARGFVVDGAIRDRDELETADVPIYCRGTSPLSAHRTWAYVDIGASITLEGTEGEVTVQSGDYVVADADGVCILPASHALDIIEDSLVLSAADAEIKKTILSGQPRDQATKSNPRLAHVKPLGKRIILPSE